MSSFNFDPEGNVSMLSDNATLTLSIPAGQNVHLYASFDGAWEQAVLIYINGDRFDGQLGSYVLRSKSLVVPQQEAAFELTLVGWHKRSCADASLPWIASRGQRMGPVVFSWDDSADDGDFRDARVKLVTS